MQEVACGSQALDGRIGRIWYGGKDRSVDAGLSAPRDTVVKLVHVLGPLEIPDAIRAQVNSLL